MSMMRKLFRPGKGQTPARYTTAFVNGTAVYSGDLVCWDITAPTSQGSSGVLAGQTLGANDFIFVILPPAAALGAQGLQAGIVRGPSLDAQAGATAMTNDDIAVIQTWGVCDRVWVDSTDTAAGNMLLTGATTGECTRALATAVNGTDATTGEGTLVGCALTADASGTRGTATTEEFATAFIRCDF